MADNYSDLIREFGSASQAKKGGASDNFDDLIKEFGSGDNAVKPTVNVEQPANLSRPPQPVSTPEQQKEYEASLARANETKSTLDKIANFAINLPVEYGKSVVEAAKSGLDTFASGFSDITQGKPASGVEKIGLGALMVPLSPITGAIKEFVEKPVTELTGNLGIGERAGIVAGTAIPINKLGSAINAARPSNRAIKNLVDAIGDPVKLAEGIGRLKENPRLSPADVWPAVLQDTQKLAVTEGKHQNKLFDFTENRNKTAKGSVESIYTDTMGRPVNVFDKLNEMKDAAKKTGREKINPIVEKAAPVNVNDVVAHIDSQLKPGITSVVSEGRPLVLSNEAKQQLRETRKLLTDNKSLRTSAKELHDIQSGLRAEAENLLNSADGQARRTGYALMDVRNRIVEAIDKSSGPINPDTKIGPYKSGLKLYKDDKDIQVAFDKGTAITRNRPGQWDDRPEFWAEWVKGASANKHEIAAAKEGARIAVDQQIHGMKMGARKGEAIPEIDFNKEKLKLLFGEKEIEKMSKQLTDERSIAITNQKLFEGSQTAMRLKSNTRVDLPEKKSVSPFGYAIGAAGEVASTAAGYPGIGLTIMAGNAARDLSHAAKVKLGKGTNIKYTDLVTAQGEARDQLIKTLESYLPKANLSVTQKATLALPFAGSRLPVAP